MDHPLPPTALPPPRGSAAPRPVSGMRRWTRRLPWIGGLVLALLIVAGLWPRPLPVEAGLVGRGPLRVTVDEEGRTRVRNRYVVAAPVSGMLRRIELKPGAPVTAGTTRLAVLETSGADLLDARSLALADARVQSAEAARAAANAQRERARASHELAQVDFTRARDLFAQGTLSRQELDTAQMRETTTAQDERAAGFNLQVAEFELAQARAIAARDQPAGTRTGLEIVTPVSGRVFRVMQESARLVAGGTPLLEVGDPVDIEVLVEALSRDAVAIRPGAEAWLDRWGGEKPLAARVRLVEPSGFTKFSALGVEEQRVNVIADLAEPLERRPTLGDGFRVEAHIVTADEANVLQVATGALFQRGGKWQTFVIDGSRARLREVEVGLSNGVASEVRSGLKEGERVVIYPGDKIRDGVRVRPTGAE